ncbi:MAG: type I glyceraldehyde-3-phosphate dehydrogenase [Thermodesulfobacteriota bacterium]
MRARIAINGFGRIGRQLARRLFCSGEPSALDLVAINTLSPIEESAHLLKHDSLWGPLPVPVEVAGGRLVIDKSPVRYFSEQSPARLPWRKLGVDLVLDCCGNSLGSREHLRAGAKRVIVAGTAADADVTLCMGVNHHLFEPALHRLVCGASCTANMAAPAILVLERAFGIRQMMATFIHSYTSEQSLLDAPHPDPRRSRAIAGNIIPSATSAVQHLEALFPSLAGRMAGLALRVPTPVVHLADLVVKVGRPGDRAALLQAFEEAAQGPLAPVLQVNHDPLVSCDFRGKSHSCIIDAAFSHMHGEMVKLLIWHDNEHAYACRILELAAWVCQCAARVD